MNKIMKKYLRLCGLLKYNIYIYIYFSIYNQLHVSEQNHEKISNGCTKDINHTGQKYQ
jgi:hypothetical protein